MTKRLQVLLDDAEWSELRRVARAERTTVAEWVRRALRAARRGSSSKGVAGKRAAIRAAAEHRFPAPPIARMNDEISRGYLDGSAP